MKLDCFITAITLVSSFSLVFSLPILKYVPRDAALVDDIDQLAARDANIYHPREIVQVEDDIVLRQLGPELERRLNIGGLARVARVVAPKIMKVAKPLASGLLRMASNARRAAVPRHVPRPTRARGSGARPRQNARNVGRRVGRSVRTVNRAANHANNIANAVTNVRDTVNSFRKPK